MEVVLILVLHQIKIDTEIPWDVYSLLWNGTVREATSPFDERLALHYYYAGSNGYQKVQSPTMLGKLFQKSATTIRRELGRGMVERMLSDIPFVRTDYLFFGAGDQ